jgi:Flp pilus assembly pilin Flp
MIEALIIPFWRDERGQGLAEYCLLTAFLALVAAALLIQVTGGLGNVWNSVNTTFGNAPAGSAPGGHN